MIYIRDSVYHKRKYDLEPRDTECMWIEIQLNHIRILFGLFYRPPNSDMSYYSSIENSISLAMDTQINNIIITGAFNLDMLSDQTARKVSELCEQFSLSQTITEPTNYTEHSFSLIDLILTSDKGNLIYSGVAEPFLHQEMRFMASSSILRLQRNHSHVAFGVTTEEITTSYETKFPIQTGIRYQIQMSMSMPLIIQTTLIL